MFSGNMQTDFGGKYTFALKIPARKTIIFMDFISETTYYRLNQL